MQTSVSSKARASPEVAEPSRERLLHAALELFATQGYAKTSTREIAEASGANLAAISYYFGDKAGLYRAVFESASLPPIAASLAAKGGRPSLRQALHALFAGFLDPLRAGEGARQCMKLHMREMIEPTGLLSEGVAEGVRATHETLIGALCQHLGLKRADDDVRRLAVCVVALGVHMHIGREVIEGLYPRLNDSAAALDLWPPRLLMYAEAMVGAEARRRRAASA
jgi:AcrR family transcriptional regulator